MRNIISFLIFGLFLQYCNGAVGSGDKLNLLPYALVGEMQKPGEGSPSGSITTNSINSTGNDMVKTGAQFNSNPTDEAIAVVTPPPPKTEGIASAPVDGGSSTGTVVLQPKLEVSYSDTMIANESTLNYSATSIYSAAPTCNDIHQNKRSIVIKNLSTATTDLVIESIVLENVGGSFGTNASSTYTIATDKSVSFLVCFNPQSAGEKMGTIVIKSNDRTNPIFNLKVKGVGSEKVIATVLKSATGVDRYQNITIQFSHAMDRGSICSASIPTNHNEGANAYNQDPIQIYEASDPTKKIFGRCSWGVYDGSKFTSYTQLIFDPYQPLDSNKSYIVKIPNGKTHTDAGGKPIDSVCITNSLDSNCNNKAILATGFTTEYKYEPSFSVNGFALGSQGLVLNKATATSITLTTTFTNSAQADSVKLKKIGVATEAAWSNSMVLSSLAGELKAVDGANSYYLEIKKGAKTYYRSFAFEWGTVASDASATVSKAGRMTMGTGSNALDLIGSFLENFIASRTKSCSVNGTSLNCSNTGSLSAGLPVYGDYIPEGTIISSISGNTVTINKASTSNGTRNIRFGSGSFTIDGKSFVDFVAYPRISYRDRSNPHASNNYCIWYNDTDVSFNYIRNYGDYRNYDASQIYQDGYCGSGGEEPGGFEGESGCTSILQSIFDMDVYITRVEMPEFVNGSTRTINASLAPTASGLNVSVKGRKAYIDLSILARNRKSICVWTVGSGSKFYFTTGVELNKNDPSLTLRDSTGVSTVTVDSNGRLKLTLEQSVVENNSFWKDWNDNLTVGNMNMIKTTSWAADLLSSITEMIANGMVPQVQRNIVKAMLKDIVEVVAPNALNSLFAQLRNDGTYNGIDVNLPDYLPAPFNRVRLNVGANIREQVTNATTTSGLEVGLDVGIKACQKDAAGKCPGETGYNSSGMVFPPALYSSGAAVDSYIKFDSLLDMPTKQSNASGGTNRISTDTGVLLTLRADAVNQAMFQLWKQGVFNLKLNQSFADTIKNFRGDNDRLFQIFQILLKASAIKKVLAPGSGSVMYAKDASNGNALIEIRDDDDVEFVVRPLLPPVAKILPLDLAKTAGNSRKFPLMEAEFGEMLIDVIGKSSTTGNQYKMATLRVNFKSKATMNIHKFSSPINNGSNDFQNVTSIQLNVCDDNDYDGNTSAASEFDCDKMRTTYTSNDDLAFSLEVLDGPVNNPLGLDPNGIYEVLNPTIQKLIIPVLNYVLGELPLEKKSKDYSADTLYKSTATEYHNQTGTKEDPNMPNNKIAANCGIRLNDLTVLPIPEGEANPYFLINVKLSDYTFSGNCSL